MCIEPLTRRPISVEPPTHPLPITPMSTFIIQALSTSQEGHVSIPVPHTQIITTYHQSIASTQATTKTNVHMM